VARALSETLGNLDKDGQDSWCLFDATWHEGIVGLVAARIKDRVGRPVVAFANSGTAGLMKGSARSIKGIHIRDVIDAIAVSQPDLVKTFGGHAMAAGLTIEAEKLAAFRAAFEAEVGRHEDALKDPDVIWTDGELAAGELSLELAEALRSGGPWGQGFPEPMFENVLEVVDFRVLKDAHLKLSVSHPDGGGLTDAIVFNQARFPDGYDGSKLRLVYRLDVNEFRNRRTAQLVVEHMQSA
jgi:single-stranded-DNA-specific exonuclease